jgi:hypothetical protein
VKNLLFVGQILRLRLRVPPELAEGMTKDEGLSGKALIGLKNKV